MVPDRDVAVAAALLIARYGSKAKVRAFYRAASLAALREFSAHKLWIDVVRAIDQLQAGDRTRITRAQDETLCAQPC
jgi:hypothetical protein